MNTALMRFQATPGSTTRRPYRCLPPGDQRVEAARTGKPFAGPRPGKADRHRRGGTVRGRLPPPVPDAGGLCEQGGTGLLILPDSTGFEASLVSLTMAGQAGPDIVGYRFEFWEQVGEGIPVLREGKDYHIVQEGETLWDISKLYGISISELARRNPNVKRPDQLAAGEKVALR